MLIGNRKKGGSPLKGVVIIPAPKIDTMTGEVDNKIAAVNTELRRQIKNFNIFPAKIIDGMSIHIQAKSEKGLCITHGNKRQCAIIEFRQLLGFYQTDYNQETKDYSIKVIKQSLEAMGLDPDSANDRSLLISVFDEILDDLFLKDDWYYEFKKEDIKEGSYGVEYGTTENPNDPLDKASQKPIGEIRVK